MTARVQAVFWTLVGAALATWAAFSFSIFKVALAVLAFVYAGLQVLRHRIIRRRLQLSPAEVATYGERLSQATPEILALWDEQHDVADIARQMEERFDLPRDVTLKYIIALGRFQRRRG